jgi:pyruvate dehydrogenase E1 component alpha subunit
MRRFELKSAKMYLDLHIGGFTHLYIGQEAVAAGAIGVLRKDDYVMSNYRDHCHYLMKGGDPNKLMAELFGKQTGVCKGKGGSMHIFDLNIGFLGGYAIVAGGLPIALGVAYSIKYRDTDQVVMAFFGDGATNAGTFYEAMNMSKLWNLPIVFVCENNFYGIGTHIKRTSATSDIYKKATAHGMPGEVIDGMDVLKVREADEEAIKYVRSGKGPFFLEARTYRFRGHSMTDHDKYRPKEEKEAWMAKDPLPKLRAQLLAESAVTEAELQKLETRIQGDVDKSEEFADESPMPPPEALYEDVYA